MSSLLAASVAIALLFLVAVAFYESLSTRDVLVGRVMRSVRRATDRRWIIALAYGTTVIVGIPLLVVLWTVILEFVLVLIGSVERLGNVASVAVSIVAAARILAYVREKTSHELAKAIPLALTFILLTGGTLRLEENLASLTDDPTRSDLSSEMVVFLIALEIGLRLVTDATRTWLAIARGRGDRGGPGFWRTTGSLLSRPFRNLERPGDLSPERLDTLPPAPR
jgi:hypothetical protein